MTFWVRHRWGINLSLPDFILQLVWRAEAEWIPVSWHKTWRVGNVARTFNSPNSSQPRNWNNGVFFKWKTDSFENKRSQCLGGHLGMKLLVLFTAIFQICKELIIINFWFYDKSCLSYSLHIMCTLHLTKVFKPLNLFPFRHFANANIYVFLWIFFFWWINVRKNLQLIVKRKDADISSSK